jgi:murein DD-endopeptidase MepM/ murein hydrolase activator NlpD
MRRQFMKDSWAERWHRYLDTVFPERQLHIRTNGEIKFVQISQVTQLCVAVVFLATASWVTFTSAKFVLHQSVVASKDNQVANAHLAYRSLLNEVANYQKKFVTLTKDLEQNHNLMLGLVEQNASLQQSLRSVETELVSTDAERKQVISARESLRQKLSAIENQMGSLATHNFSLKDNLHSIESDLEMALSGRNEALVKNQQLTQSLKDLQTRLIDLQDSEQESVLRLTENTHEQIAGMEKVIKLSGLDVKKVFKAANKPQPTGQGGPFIPVTSDGIPGGSLKASLNNLDAMLDHSKDLQEIMQQLPLVAPLKSYYVTSRFGKRRDPINKRWAAHYGLDLGSPFKTPVYVTSPGVVTFVGWKGNFGRLVEVTHGSGIKTRYGHLHKTLVKRGQKVKFQQKIGLLGSTGRSTGAHLHYEVLFNNKTINPMKFIKAGRYVFQDKQ